MPGLWHDLVFTKKEEKFHNCILFQQEDGMINETWGAFTEAALSPLPRTWRYGRQLLSHAVQVT